MAAVTLPAASPSDDASPPAQVPPGASARSRRKRTHIDWELIDCGLSGHHLVGTDAASVGPDDDLFVRDIGSAGGTDACAATPGRLWPRRAPDAPSVPSRDEIDLPLRGSALRDRFVLRVIAVERVVHVIVLTLLVVGIFVFASHKRTLDDDYTRILADLQGTFGGTTGRHGILADINRLFAIRTKYLYLIGIGLAVYTAVLALETVGLWYDRRWAEYLTFVETSVLLPYEIYELAHGVSALKVISLVLNLAILLYLALGHRLFGLRGGLAALRARRERSNSWEAIEAATPGRWP